ncbi:flagellar assembly protein FliH [Butyrivibrio proteoclasticus B316]|uniref:Flagellar assembly protein FliH n=1 Tax=Butyrivibrio proteoclasticus (strain ATCC 51982 / DSM 14932 / B316) TaxID=515622 RepID=E0RUQ7_BUTPB|nr:FliH/SctL family protein [Butyrivibrio proteoclasticus]ADL34098.1 flagellar assembly protein FliH [Butyrivibrio proteoclasticus B316]
MSNLFKGGFVNYDDTEKFVIDSNELANQKIEAFQERELKRQRAMMSEEEGYAPEGNDGDFVPGIDMEQLSQLTEDQGMMEPYPDPQFDMEAMQAEMDLKIQQAQEQADMIIQNAQEQANQIISQAQEEGHRQGYEAGYQEGVQAAEALKADIEQQRGDLEAQYQQIVDGLEPEMVDVLTQIYEHVFGVELRDDKEIILHLLKSTLSRIEPGKDLIVHVSSDDYDDVIEERESLEACITSPNTTMEIIEDPLLKENECMIESDSGVFDCSLGVELSELSRKLKLLSFDRAKR